MKILIPLLFCLLTTLSFAQMPSPFISGGVNLNGSGMSAAGGTGVAGIIWESSHFFIMPEAGYSTGGKNDDNTNTSSSGHTRYLEANTLIKTGKWYFGPGATWLKLYTPNYSKSAWNPQGTIGRDFNSYISKIFVTYETAGTDKSNGMHGIETQLWWTFGRHFFLREKVGIWIGHATITCSDQSINCIQLTAKERSERLSSGELQTIVGWRF
jgi:hypothetical protein